MFVTRRLAVATLVLVLNLAPVFAQTAPPETAPPPDTTVSPDTPKSDKPRQGDRWTYERKDEVTDEITGLITDTVTEVTDKEIVVRRTFSNKPQVTQTIVYDHNWNGIGIGDWKFTPDDRLGIVTPFKPGRAWRFNISARNVINDAIAHGEVQGKVVDQESVTTKAGTFDTFKILYARRERNTLNPARKFNVLIDMFYAPAVNHWVRRRYRSLVDGRLQEDSSLELVDFTRKP
jgi:hypothetical protein